MVDGVPFHNRHLCFCCYTCRAPSCKPMTPQASEVVTPARAKPELGWKVNSDLWHFWWLSEATLKKWWQNHYQCTISPILPIRQWNFMGSWWLDGSHSTTGICVFAISICRAPSQNLMTPRCPCCNPQRGRSRSWVGKNWFGDILTVAKHRSKNGDKFHTTKQLDPPNHLPLSLETNTSKTRFWELFSKIIVSDFNYCFYITSSHFSLSFPKNKSMWTLQGRCFDYICTLYQTQLGLWCLNQHIYVNLAFIAIFFLLGYRSFLCVWLLLYLDSHPYRLNFFFLSPSQPSSRQLRRYS